MSTNDDDEDFLMALSDDDTAAAPVPTPQEPKPDLKIITVPAKISNDNDDEFFQKVEKTAKLLGIPICSPKKKIAVPPFSASAKPKDRPVHRAPRHVVKRFVSARPAYVPRIQPFSVADLNALPSTSGITPSPRTTSLETERMNLKRRRICFDLDKED